MRPRMEGYPLPLCAVNAAAGAGFTEIGAQNLDPQGLSSQNIDFKELAEHPRMADYTAFALAMMGVSAIERKVRCHIRCNPPVENS
jgi:hypothetical protein